MRDIEDEVKCSECPNARHGFDRDASHNEGRYVCQCESHKCPAESLRQQLAEANAEIERLNFKLQNQALDCIAADGQAFDSWQQLAASQAREQQLREALNHHHEIGLGRGRDKSHSLSQLIISGYKHGPLCRITDEALAQPTDTAALEAMITKAGEVMRERCRKVAFDMAYADSMAVDVSQTIRAIHAVTLDDLK